MIVLVRLFVAVSLILGAWRRFREMGPAIRYDGHRYWQCEDGLFRRWYGGHGRTAAELGAPDRADDPGLTRPIPPIRSRERTYYYCDDGYYRRWYGGQGRTAEELGAELADAA